MTVYSSSANWYFSQHSQLRAEQRRIHRQEVLALLAGFHTSYPSRHHDSSARVVVGHDGLVAVVDPQRRSVITVFRRHVSATF